MIFQRESQVLVINHCLSTVVNNFIYLNRSVHTLSILGTLFFFCFVLSYSRAVPIQFHTPGDVKTFDMFLQPLTKYATVISRANQIFVMVGAEMNSCVLLTLNISL